MNLDNYTIRSPKSADTDFCYEIESSSYEGDEAATREKIAHRIQTYPEGFMIIETDHGIAGFINSGSTNHVVMSDESFKELVGHDPNGRHNVIMSVVVCQDFQGQGISSILMHNYILRMKRLKKESIHLMCKDRHVSFYEKFGFTYEKKSTSSHGGMSWHEMVLNLSNISILVSR
jgi:ribosomal protein S18 acetylase RimI-like enzyme